MIGKWLEKRRFRQAMNCLEVEDYEKAAVLFSKLEHSRDPDIAVPTLSILSNMKLHRGDLAGAEESLDRVGELYRGFDVSAQTLSGFHLQRADVYRHQRKFGPALLAAEDADKIDPNRSARTQLAWMRKMYGQVEDAITLLEVLVAEQPDDYMTRLSLIGYLHVAKRHQEAERMLAAYQPEDDPTVIANLAWIAACKNDLDTCLRMLDRANGICDREWLREFCRMDVEFDRFRDDERFRRAVS